MFTIPVYAGSYNMAADSLQAELVTIRDEIEAVAFTPEEWRAVYDTVNTDVRARLGRWAETRELEAGFHAALAERWPELQARPDVARLAEHFARIREVLVREHGKNES